MLNKKNRVEATNKLQTEISKYENYKMKMISDSELLYASRISLSETVKKIWELLNSMRNTPTDFNVEVKKLKIEFERFENFVENINNEVYKTFKTSAGGAGAGIMAGAGIAAFGPSAAMAIATTFGTASTGTAISTLSGAAASKAALAWLGGGALAAGGAGTAGGSALLAMTGPIGWTIGAVSLTGAGLFRNAKNKRIANEAREKTVEIKTQNKILQATSNEIRQLNYLTKRTNEKIDRSYNDNLDRLAQYEMDYRKIKSAGDTNLIEDLGSLINQTLGSTELLNKAVGEKND